MSAYRRRARRKPLAPTTAASVVEARSRRPGALSRGAVRRELVPSDLFGKALAPDYHGRHMSPRAKRAAVAAAGATPVVGDFAAAATAARLAPPEQRRAAAATQYAGSQGGGLAGAAAGAYGLSRLAHSSPRVSRGTEALNNKINSVKERVPGHARLVATGQKLGDAARRFPKPAGASAGRAGAAARAFKAPIKAAPAAAAVGALVGSTVGAQVGGYAGYGHVLHREQKRNATLASVGKAQTLPDGVRLSQRQQAQLRRRKRANAAASTVTGTLGIAAFGALGAKRVRRFSPAVRHHLNSAPTTLGTASLGLGGANSLLGASIQRREAGVKKALVPTRRPTYGASYLQRRRGPAGVQAVRISAGVR